jgi:hypothetical protein
MVLVAASSIRIVFLLTLRVFISRDRLVMKQAIQNLFINQDF